MEFILQPDEAPTIERSWLARDGAFVQGLAHMQDCVGRPLGGAEVVDCAGQDLDDQLVHDIFAWLDRHGLLVSSLDLSGCNLTDAVASSIARHMNDWVWLKHVGLAENRLITISGAKTLRDAAENKTRQDLKIYIDVAPKVGARRQCLIRQYLHLRWIHPGEAFGLYFAARRSSDN